METETKVQHTAGPWNFHEHYHPFDDTISVVNSEDGFHYKTITIAKGAMRLAEVIWDDAKSGGYPLVETVEEMKANACLILVSPELLEVLQTIVANATLAPDPRMNNSTDCYLVPLDDIETARAVVEKATKR